MKYYFVKCSLSVQNGSQIDKKDFSGIIQLNSASEIQEYFEKHFNVRFFFNSTVWWISFDLVNYLGE